MSSDVSCCRSTLVAACEQNDLLMFDPHNAKLIGTKVAAHTDSVNCVRCVNASLLVYLQFSAIFGGLILW